MKTLNIIIAAALLTSISAPMLRAQEEIFFIGQELGVGARAAGLGGAFVGIADDYSAIYWNPAGLGQMSRMELNLGFSHNKVVNTADFLGVRSRAEDTFTRLNSIGLTIPVPTYQGSLVFGFGYNKVTDFDNRFEIEGYNEKWAAYPDYFYQTAEDYQYTTVENNLYQQQSVIEQGTLNHFSFAGAVEVQQNFFLGAALNFINGKDDYSLDFAESDIYNLHNVYQEYDADSLENISDLDWWNYRRSIVSDFGAVNFKIGGLYRFGRMLRLGAAVKTPTTYKIKETWADSWEEHFDSGDSFSVDEQSGVTEYKIRTPYTFSFGGSLKMLNFLFSAAADFEDWSQAEFLTHPPVADQTRSQVNARIAKDFKSITRYRLGAEMYIPLIRARVRAGWCQDPSPYRYTAVRPDKQYLSAGFGIMLDRQVMVDLSLQHGMWKRQTIDDLTRTPADENVTFDKVMGTLSIRF